MKPHPRIRKTVKWGGAVVTVLLVVGLVGSGYALVYVFLASGPAVQLEGGGLIVGWGIQAPPAESGCVFDWRGDRPSWHRLRFQVWSFPGASWQLNVPLWAPCLFSLTTTIVTWRLDTLARRRARTPHLCPKCNYDRTGLAPGAVCPECGAAPVGV